jgi:hypothetical protein
LSRIDFPEGKRFFDQGRSTNLRRSASAASGPGMVIVILDDEATLYFLANGLHSLILTNNSKIVLAKILIIGEMIDGKKLKEFI